MSWLQSEFINNRPLQKYCCFETRFWRVQFAEIRHNDVTMVTLAVAWFSAYSSTCYSCGPGSRPVESIWNVWWTKWHWVPLFSLSISFHRCSPQLYINWLMNNRPFGDHSSETWPLGGCSSETQPHPIGINNKNNHGNKWPLLQRRKPLLMSSWHGMNAFHLSPSAELSGVAYRISSYVLHICPYVHDPILAAMSLLIMRICGINRETNLFRLRQGLKPTTSQLETLKTPESFLDYLTTLYHFNCYVVYNE
jgi:hypothetical protein